MATSVKENEKYKKGIETFIKTFELIYTVSFTVCIINCVEVVLDGGVLKWFPYLLSLTLLLIAFRLIFATKALNDYLNEREEINSLTVIPGHTLCMAIQSGCIYAASVQLTKPNHEAESMLCCGIAILVNGIWLLTLKKNNLWAFNNIVCSALTFVLYFSHCHLLWMVLVLLLNSGIDFFATSDWYIGLKPETSPGRHLINRFF